MFCWHRRHLEKHCRQHRKYRRLNEADEYFECEERQWDDIWREMQHDRQKDFPRKHVAKQSESK